MAAGNHDTFIAMGLRFNDKENDIFSKLTKVINFEFKNPAIMLVQRVHFECYLYLFLKKYFSNILNIFNNYINLLIINYLII